MAVDDSGRDIVLEAALRKLFGGENPFGVAALPVTLDASGKPVHPVLTATGTRTIHTLDPDDGDADGAATNEFYSSATGCLAFRIIPLPQAEADYSALLAVIFGWSTDAAAVAAINTQMALADAAITTPSTADGSAANGTNVGVIVPGSNAPTLATAGVTWYGDLDWVLWDGVTTIKTITARTSGDVFTGGLLLEVIE